MPFLRAGQTRARWLHFPIVAAAFVAAGVALAATSSRRLMPVEGRIASLDEVPWPTRVWPTAALLAALAALVAIARRPEGSGRAARVFAPLLVLAWTPRHPSLLEGVWVATAFAAVCGLFLWTEPHTPRAPRVSGRVWAGLVLAAAGILAVWIFYYQWWALHELVLGHADLSIHYTRIRAMASGREWFGSPLFPAFDDHVNVGMLLWVPLAWLVPGVEMIFVAQALSLAATVVAIWLLARLHLGRGGAAAACGFVAALYPGLSQMGYSYSYGFHLSSTALPLMVLSVWQRDLGRWWGFAALAALACLMKEVHAVFYVALGFIEFARSPRAPNARAHLVTGAVAAVYLAAAVLWILPALAPTRAYERANLFLWMGSSPREVAAFAASHPVEMIRRLVRPEVWTYLAMLLGSFAFVPLLEPAVLLWGGLSLLGTSLMSYERMLNVAFWYQVDLLAAALVAFVYGIRRLHARFGARASSAALGAALVAASGATWSYGLTPLSRETLPPAMHRGFADPDYAAASADLRRMRAQLAPGTRLLATGRILTLYLDLPEARSLDRVGAEPWDEPWDVVLLDPRETLWSTSRERLRAVSRGFAGTGRFDAFTRASITLFARRGADLPPGFPGPGWARRRPAGS